MARDFGVRKTGAATPEGNAARASGVALPEREHGEAERRRDLCGRSGTDLINFSMKRAVDAL